MFILLIVSLFLISFVSSICECNTYCDGEYSCYFGSDCSPPPAACSGAEECPITFCPLLSLSDTCVEDNVFITDNGGPCDEELEVIIEDSSEECKQTIKGNISDNNNFPIFNTNILIQFSSFYSGVNLNPYYSSKFSNLSDSNFTLIIPKSSDDSFDVNIIVTKDKYDADVKSFNVIDDSTLGILEENFTLVSGTCTADCTDSFNRCNPECQGFIDVNGDNCSFYSYEPNYPASLIMDKCAYKLKGTSVILNISDDTYEVVECCEGGASAGGPPEEIYRPSSHLIMSDKRDIVSVEKPVKLSTGEAGILKLIVWN